MPRFTLRHLLGAVTLCAIGSCTVMSFQSRVTYNASRKDVWLNLPADATNINHFEPSAFGPSTCFEFDTSETSFLDWVRGHNVTRVSQPAPYRMYRYPYYGPNASTDSEVTIKSGYLFEWTEEDRGQHIAYDKDTGRAYYFSHTR